MSVGCVSHAYVNEYPEQMFKAAPIVPQGIVYVEAGGIAVEVTTGGLNQVIYCVLQNNNSH